MDSKLQDYQATDDHNEEVRNEEPTHVHKGPRGVWWGRKRYFGSFLFNIATFLLPAVYGTLSKLWVAQIDGSMVATTDAYTYIGIFAEVINEGLPRGVFVVIGDRSSRSIQSRVNITYTLIYVQAALGLLLSVIFCASAASFAATFVPIETREASLTYVRISSFSTFFSAISVAVSAATRALDRPDIPLGISCTTTFVNIILDLALISTVRSKSINPTVNTQAAIRLTCEGCGALAGLLFYFFTSKKALSSTSVPIKAATRPNWLALKQLVRAGVFTFTESAVRNALYLWLISNIVSMGSNYATAWGVFNTIRWGLIMVPVQALEASSVTFVGHKWGAWRAKIGSNIRKAKATWKDIYRIIIPALRSLTIVFFIEILLFIILAYTGGIKSFAHYLSNSDEVSEITEMMWKSIEWCYIFYALSTQLATILLATQPRWYLYQSLGSNILYVLPWCIAVTKIGVTEDNAWLYHRWIFGGSLVVSFGIILFVDLIWALWLRSGRSEMAPIQETIA